MSDREFDNYLALLSRLLRLGDKQRSAIAGELRTHLEDRLEDLLARGVSRDEAIRQALEEFGDAALLAAEFASIRGRTRKRWIMRLATASVAAIVLIAAGIFTFWPGTSAGPGAATSVAQIQPETKADPTHKESPAEKRVPIKDVLDRRMEFIFSEKSLASVVQQIGEQTGITIYLDARHLEEAGVNRDTPVTHAFTDIRLRTFLDLMLGELDLTYMVKDDVLFITTPEYAESPDHMIVRVYDCRELLALPSPPGSTTNRVPIATSGAGGGFFAIQDEPAQKGAPGGDQDAPPPVVGNSGGTPPPAQNASDSGRFGSAGSGLAGSEALGDSDNLIEVITTIIDPDSWRDVGGPGGIAEYKGLLTVAATQAVHEKVERLLNMLHQAGNLKELKVTVIE